MFLGIYDNDCTVEFSLRFNSTEASEIYLGLSKKPWAINHQSSNIGKIFDKEYLNCILSF